MSTVLQLIIILLSFWHKAQKDNSLLESVEEAIKYNYFDQVNVDFGQWRKEILTVTESGYPTHEASDDIHRYK